jgi:hypothetical protein
MKGGAFDGSNLNTKIFYRMSTMEKVKVPADLLLNSTITASAKLIWMILKLHPELTKQGRPSPTRLAVLTGLSRPTVRKGLATLAAAGWYRLSPPGISLPSTEPKPWRFVQMPIELLEDRSVRPQAVVMYGVLQATPGFDPPTGKYTRKQLREMTGKALKTISRATNMLVQRGWLERTRKNHLCPYIFTVKNPVYEQCLEEIESLKRLLSRPNRKGEQLMRGHLSLIVASNEFEDDASPGFLVNPFTKEEMQLDRYYPGKAAFEFNGQQHYEPTEFATQEDVEKQQARDDIKAGICRRRGIPLIVVHPEDLTLETMIQKVGNHLPLRDLRHKQPVIRFLERVSRGYRQAARREQALAAKRAAETGR